MIRQFVTLWQRSEDGSTQPYDVSDPADVYVISTRSGSHFGQFVFPKHVLLQPRYHIGSRQRWQASHTSISALGQSNK
ncbi:MepB family protein [Paenibacillus amylolyticus]|uniref:MepB family protein n=1 Tax=Paenibacillus amylolyticus TaxID=1451 RepID=UPI003241E6FB